MKIGFVVGGERTRVEKADAEEIVKRFHLTTKNARKGLESNNVVLDKLDISCRAWPLGSLKIFFNDPVVQESLSSITILKMDDIIASLLTDEGLECMGFIANVLTKTNCVLQELDLSHNALGTRGIHVLQPLLSIRSLRRIYLNNCGLSAEVTETLCETLRPIADQIQLLSLGRNQLGVVGGQFIKELITNCVRLQYLDYSGCRPLQDGTKHLCEGIYNMVEKASNSATSATNGVCVLQYLNLDDCHINSGEDDDDENQTIQRLCTALCKCSLLSTLIVRDCNLESMGLSRILDSLSTSHCALKCLDIGCNEIGTKGCTLLNEYLTSTNGSGSLLSLETLIIDTNEIENNGLIALSSSFQVLHNLQQLNLQCNNITDLSCLQNIVVTSKTFRIIDLVDNNELTMQQIRHLQKKFHNTGDHSNSMTIIFDDDLEEGEDEDEEDGNNQLDDLLSGLKKINLN